MKTLIVFLLLFLVIQASPGQWVLQPRVTTASLSQIQFVDDTTGWAVGTSASDTSCILKTSNGGDSWAEMKLQGFRLFAISMVDRFTGWSVGRTVSKKGMLVTTTDGGDTWLVADSSAANTYYYSVQFIDELHGWVGGWNDTTSIVRRTTDGGSTWQTSYVPDLDVNELCFLDSLNGWDVGQNGMIYKTTDAGTTWQSVFTVPDPNDSLSTTPLRRIQFTDAAHGYAIGGISGGEVKVWTSDSGATWNVVSKQLGSSLHGMWFTDALNGWCVGGANAGETIQRTTDGGQTWTQQTIPPGVDPGIYLEDVFFVSPTIGWIVAENGIMLKTTNGGVTGVPSDLTQDTPSSFQLHQNYPNPFNPSTRITYVLPASSQISLRIFDMLGHEIAVIVDAEVSAGTYTATWDASAYPAGVYLCRLQAGTFVKTRKLVLLK